MCRLDSPFRRKESSAEELGRCTGPRHKGTQFPTRAIRCGGDEDLSVGSSYLRRLQESLSICLELPLTLFKFFRASSNETPRADGRFGYVANNYSAIEYLCDDRAKTNPLAKANR
jgi:hypothetical protein